MSVKTILLPVVRPILPYLPYLPAPLLSLAPTLALHLTTHSSPSPWTFFTSPTVHPLHPPLLLLFASIPLIYTLGLISGNVSWVDRIWPFFTPLCTILAFGYLLFNASAGIYAHNIPRVGLMLALQIIWSIRLTSHAIKRGFYDLTGEDYRYTQFRKIAPRLLFTFVHLFVIAIAQPILLFALHLPVQAVLLLPPSELSAGPIPALSIPFSLLAPLLPHSTTQAWTPAPASTPVLNLFDLGFALLSLTCVYVEYMADNAMYRFQEAKHNPSPTSKIVQPTSSTPTSILANAPRPTSYPSSHHPGFPTKGLWKWSRHPNFAGEQLFWLCQALFVVGAGQSSGVTRAGWVGGSVFAPPLALSILFCASTYLTEWITSCKYPAYSNYRRLVGQFLPQETVLVWLWSTLRNTRKEDKKVISDLPTGTSVLHEKVTQSRAGK